MYRQTTIWIIVATLINLCSFRGALACPFCAPASLTFREEIAGADAATIAKLVQLAEETTVEDLSGAQFDNGRSAPRAKFEILEVLKGDGNIGDTTTIEVVYFGDGSIGDTFLILGQNAPQLNWLTPISVSAIAHEYLKGVVQLPAEGYDGLEFFLDYLEHDDELLARDAYDEFARTKYEGLQLLKEKLEHDRLIEWIEDFEVPPSRRRLYLTMLGICGNADDRVMLEKMIRSDDRKMKSGLDAMIACYLNLIGEEGVELIEDLFLKNSEAEYTDTYAAIMALRFHGSQAEVISTDRVVKALRCMLDRPQLADLVVPDLARWEDWDSMPRLINLFKDATDENSWVRVPVINYLRKCQLPEAEVAIAELEKIDPDAVRRARTFFPEGTEEKTDSTVVKEKEKVQTEDQLSSKVSEPVEVPVPKLSTVSSTTENQQVVESITGDLPEATTVSSDSAGSDSSVEPRETISTGLPWTNGIVMVISLLSLVFVTIVWKIANNRSSQS